MKTRLRQPIRQLFDARATPHEIALGFALGTFIEILPAFGFKTILSLLLAGRFKSVNKAALFVAVAIWNTFLIVPIYGMSYQLGNMFFGTSTCGGPIPGGEPMYSGLECFVAVFLPAVLVIAAAIAMMTYVVLRLAVTGYQNRAAGD